MVNQENTVEMANQYFSNQMDKVSVRRVEYNVTETFKEYLSHRYRNNCYNYSAFAMMGLGKDDKLVRGDICLPDDDWRWCNGGYGHVWIEFSYNGEEFVFDSRCKSIMRKDEWYEIFKPEKMVKFTQAEVLDMILAEGGMEQHGTGYYKVKDMSQKEDPDHRVKTLTKAEIYMSGQKIERFVAYRNPFE